MHITYFFGFVNLIGIIFFTIGFFPTKKTLSGYADKDNVSILYQSVNNRVDEVNVHSNFENALNFENSSVSKLILVVIDALRLDFVTGEKFKHNFSYLNQILNKKEAILYHGKANAPTVTLPRIKAMTTGEVQNFIDVLYNFFSSELVSDNFLSQAKRFGKVINFYGDETWVKLFPNCFKRYEGTTSFYVADYTQVDANVTRNLDSELNKSDWDVLILHYLGLDHIGHLEGPFSPLVPDKLKEMDNVIKKIHQSLKIRSETDGESILIISGDHGMSDHGSHGGSTNEETSVPIIFASSSRHFEGFDENPKKVLQISMAPTISVLLNLPIPKNNIGLILHQTLLQFDEKQKLFALFSNYQQIRKLLAENEIDDTPIKMHRDWLLNTSKLDATMVLESYKRVIEQIGGELSSKLTNHDLYLILFIVIALWQNFICIVGSELFQISNCVNIRHFFAVFIVLIIIHSIMCSNVALNVIGDSCLCRVTPMWSLLSTVLLFLLFTYISCCCVHCIQKLFEYSKQREILISPLPCFLVVAWLMHCASFASSSFIEEEHYICYFLTTTFHFVCLTTILCNAQTVRKFNQELYMIGSWLCTRILMDWNRGGDKWANLPDVKQWIIKDENSIYLSLAILCGLVIIIILKFPTSGIEDLPLLTGIMLVSNIKIPHLSCLKNFLSEIMTIRLIYLTILIRLMMILLKPKLESVLMTFINCWLLLSFLLMRPHNIPMLAIICLQENLLSRFINISKNNLITMTCVYYMMAMTSFFHQGNGNSISRIDVATGYTGLSDYNPVIVAFLLLSHTYSCVIFWLTSLLYRISQQRTNSSRRLILKATSMLILIRSLPICVIIIILTLMRHHLFIWSVFSPKFLYEITHSLLINVLCIFIYLLLNRI